MQQGRIVVVLFMVATIIIGTTLGSKNVSSPPDKEMDALSSLGEITTKLVTTLVEDDDEKVDIYAMADLLTSMSKAAIIVEHPDLYNDLTTNDVEEQIVKLSSTVRVLAEQQRTLQETIDIQAERLLVVDEMAYELNQSQAIIALLEEQIQSKPSGSASSFVGFTAWADVYTSYDDEETVQFPQVLFNYGSAYDKYSSKFTCPYSGIYSVNVHVEERNSAGLIVDAMLDTDALFRVHVHDDSTDHGTSATSAMVGCRQGQDIYVMNQDSGSGVDLSTNEKRSIFSVYLIKTMPDDEVQSGNMLGS